MMMLRPLHVLTLAAAAVVAAAPAFACSTCKCGDYTINLLGSEKPFDNRVRAGVDYLWRSEDAGAAGGHRSTDEQRMLIGLAWSPGLDWSFAVQAPYVHKQIESDEEGRLSASGLGDVDLVGRWVGLRSGGSGSGRHLAGARFGVRLPTAAEERDDSGALLDIDVQPDAGATVPNLGGWYSYFRYPLFITATATYFRFSEAHQDFTPGDVATFSLLGQYGVSQRVALQLGADARRAQQNRDEGVVDDDSGGSLVMGFGGIAVRAFDDLVINAGVQLPLIDRLNGLQDEHAVFRAGLAYDF